VNIQLNVVVSSSCCSGYWVLVQWLSSCTCCGQQQGL